jgi:small-conductance mechanosensitive channel
LERALDEGGEAFEKSTSATPEEYRDYTQLLGKIVEMRALIAERHASGQILAAQAEKVQEAIAHFQPPEVTAATGLSLYDSARLDLWQAQSWLSALNKIGDNRAEQERASFTVLKQEQLALQSLQSAALASPRETWLLRLQEIRVAAALADHESKAATASWKEDVTLQEARINLAQLTIKSLQGRISFPAEGLESRQNELERVESADQKDVQKLEAQITAFPSNNPLRRFPALADLLLEGMQNQLQLLEYKRVVVTISMQIWQVRQEIWNTTEPSTLEKLSRNLEARMQDFQTWQPIISGIRTKLQDRRRRAALLLANTTPPPSQQARDFVDKILDQEENALSRWENGFAQMVELNTLANADIAEKKTSPGVAQNLNAAANSLTTQIATVWNTELFTLSDSVFVNGQVVQRPSSVTLGMLLTACGILLAGGFVSSAASRWLRVRLTSRFALDANTGVIIQKFTHFLFLILICLVALAIVRIPLTIFALLGGAAAIAVGFGAQQLVNNLISGIILLLERPIRIGDVIDVGTSSGTVTSIGTRCCQLSRYDGVEILIPNSVILQSTVVNWTLTDHNARQEMLVGIAYGSSVEQAAQIIHSLAIAHPGVLKDHDTNVFFHDFGSDALVLRLLYWIDRGVPGSTNQVRSEIRFAIYKAFAAAGIVLAFPQRDVHLDATKPLAVQILPPTQRGTP